MVYLERYPITDEGDLINCKKNVTESREIVNPDLVQKYFPSL